MYASAGLSLGMLWTPRTPWSTALVAFSFAVAWLRVFVSLHDEVPCDGALLGRAAAPVIAISCWVPH